jgi:hypothetical protein
MPQNLRTTFSLIPHRPARPIQLPARSVPTYSSLEALLCAMQQMLQKAKSDLLQPRKQVIDRILLEAASLH